METIKTISPELEGIIKFTADLGTYSIQALLWRMGKKQTWVGRNKNKTKPSNQKNTNDMSDFKNWGDKEHFVYYTVCALATSRQKKSTWIPWQQNKGY